MRLQTVLTAVLVLAGCSRDLTVPAPPGPGSLQGTVVYASEGRSGARPAGGAVVELTRFDRSTTALEGSGFFRFDQLTSDEGFAVFRFRAGGDSEGVDYQKRIRLADLGVGYGKHVDLGPVLLGPSASASGKVLRADVPQAQGHAGTLVFVPEGPALVQTGDDGSFTMTNLPEGPFSLSVFRDGYASRSLDGVLRAGEDFRLLTVVLAPLIAPPEPSVLAGRVVLLGRDEALGIAVSASGTGGTAATLTDTDGNFELPSLAVGVYALTLVKEAFRTVTLRNVLARSGRVDLGTLTMTPGSSTPAPTDLPGAHDGGGLDSGVGGDAGPPASDGGVDAGGDSGSSLDAGMDGGVAVGDAGGGDAGTAPAGPADAGVSSDAGPWDAFPDGGLVVLSGAGERGYTTGQLNSLVTVELRGRGNVPLPNVTLRAITAPLGAAVVPERFTTASNGRASFDVLLPRNPGPLSIVVQNVDGGGPLATVPLVAELPPAGHIATLVNRDRTSGSDGQLGPSPWAHVNLPRDVAVSGDGTLYFTDWSNNQVKQVSPQGVLSLVTGTGAAGSTGNGGPALAATLNSPWGLALDDLNHLLYVADEFSDVVRVVDLRAGTIDLVAGGGTATAPGYGDGSVATNAVLSRPTWLGFARVAGAPMLYVSDSSHQRVRRIALSTHTIHGFLATGDSSNSVTFRGCPSTGCPVAADSAGSVYVGGQWQVQATGYFWGVGRVSAPGGLSLVAGRPAPGNTGEPLSSLLVSFSTAPSLAFDAAGDLFVADELGAVVQRIEAGTGRLRTLAGTRVSAAGPDFVAATGSALRGPGGLAFDSDGNLALVDTSAHCLRSVWGLGRQSPVSPKLVVVSGNGQVAGLFQGPPSPLQVRLVDEVGQPLAGYRVRWTPSLPGSWTYAAVSTTDASGSAWGVVRAGLIAERYTFTATFEDVFGTAASGGPVSFELTANVPAPKTIFTLVNLDHTAGNDGVPGAGHAAHIGAPGALAVASDGSVYFAERGQNRIRVLRPSGLLEHLAGDSAGAAGYAGDNGPADGARLSLPSGLALDEPNRHLYVSDTQNHVVRRVDLAQSPPVIEAFAGVNSPSAPLNDGSPASLAGLSGPTHLALRVEGATQYLYVTDQGHHRVAKLTTSGTFSTTFFSAAIGPQTGVRPTGASFCDQASSCSFAWDASGAFFLAGHFFDGVFYNPQGVARWNQANNTMALITGSSASGPFPDGALASTVSWNEAPFILFDAADQLVLVGPSAHRVRFIDAGGKLGTLAGDGAAGYAGDFVAATGSRVSSPSSARYANGHLYFTDEGNAALRVVW